MLNELYVSILYLNFSISSPLSLLRSPSSRNPKCFGKEWATLLRER